MHVVCNTHKKRVLFFLFEGNARKAAGLVVRHRSDGERCSLPLMAEGKRIPLAVIKQALEGGGGNVGRRV